MRFRDREGRMRTAALNESQHDILGTEQKTQILRIHSRTFMTATISPQIDHIAALLAKQGYDVSQPGPGVLDIREVRSGISVHAVLEGEIMFFTLPCLTVPEGKLTQDILKKMLAGENGISTSYFQLYDGPGGTVTIALNNFCKLLDLGPENEDDILSCVHFLLVDVIAARDLVGAAAK